MISGTTPTLKLRIKKETVDLSQAENIYVSIRQGKTTYIEKSGDYIELDGQRLVKVWLTQEESFRLTPGVMAWVQINWTYLDAYNNHRRAATRFAEIPITPQLLERVVQ